MVDLRRYKARESCPNWLKLWRKTLATDELATQSVKPVWLHSATALVWQITLPCHFHGGGGGGGGGYINTDVSTTVSLTKRQKISFRKTNKWTKYDSLTCLKMWPNYWNHPENDNIKHNEHRKKIMDLQACHDNLTCSPNEWAEQSITEMKLSMHAAFNRIWKHNEMMHKCKQK